jgi:6-pyruvoyltetrahydropterin/6-carboxytetrahydropterin synthase
VFEVAVESGFSAAHRLRGYEGACERLHGHNYRVEASVRADGLEPSGMLVDFRALRAALGEVLGALDHRCLNDDLPDFAEGKLNPTAENIARWIAERLDEALGDALAGGARLARVTVWESETSKATYVLEQG